MYILEGFWMPDRARRARHQRGQGMLECGLIILFVVLVVFGGLILLGPVISNVFANVWPAL